MACILFRLPPQPHTGYAQTTEYTCGSAVLMALAHYYARPDVSLDAATEMRIAREIGTRDMDRDMDVLNSDGKPGTTPQEMADWLTVNGFDVTVSYEDKEDGSGLTSLRENLSKGLPTIVEWADITGHWVIVVGYDTRNTADPGDDVLIMADS